jgi:serine/threonine-protein kinase Chk2
MAVVRGSVAMQQRVIVQMTEALVFLHGRDLAHMDIKPENVLFADRALTICKLCDFGLAARARVPAAAAAAAPVSPSVLPSAFFGAGTDGYMAPEVKLQAAMAAYGHAAAAAASTQRADVFSLGVVAIELLTGMAAATISASAVVGPASLVPQLVAVGVAGEVAALLVRCVAGKVVKRPKAAELYQALCSVWSDVDE